MAAKIQIASLSNTWGPYTFANCWWIGIIGVLIVFNVGLWLIEGLNIRNLKSALPF
tara:strand:- start:1201 stop:1368 length:168 start_codon:yes stop_codon:yes gene_type:complete